MIELAVVRTIMVGSARLTALPAYPGPSVHPEALRATGSGSINPSPSVPAARALQQSEISSWLL